jgi:manganese transport protein
MKRIGAVLLWSIIAAAFIGPGTVTTAASAGAAHGYALLWALLFSTIATLVLQEAAARVTIVSGRTLGGAIREQFRKSRFRLPVLALVLGAVVVGNAAYEAGNILGAAAGVSLGTGLPPAIVAGLVGCVAGMLLWMGSPRAVAHVLSATVAVMGAAFLFTAWRLAPAPADLIRGAAVPIVPQGAGLLVLGLVGTTVVPYNLFLGSGLADGQRLREVRIGLAVAVVLGGVISAGVLVVGAAVAGPFGFEPLVATLTGRLGAWAGGLFAWGLFAAGFSSATTAPLAAALTARSLQPEGDPRWIPTAWRYRAVWMGVLGVGTAFGLAGVRPIPAIILAQALNGVLLPFAAVFLLLVVNDRGLMGGEGLNGRWANLLMSGVVGVAVVLGSSGVLRAGAAALALPPPGEALLLGGGAAVALLLAPLVGRSIRRRRAAPTPLEAARYASASSGPKR